MAHECHICTGHTPLNSRALPAICFGTDIGSPSSVSTRQDLAFGMHAFDWMFFRRLCCRGTEMKRIESGFAHHERSGFGFGEQTMKDFSHVSRVSPPFNACWLLKMVEIYDWQCVLHSFGEDPLL